MGPPRFFLSAAAGRSRGLKIFCFFLLVSREVKKVEGIVDIATSHTNPLSRSLFSLSRGKRTRTCSRIKVLAGALQLVLLLR